MKINLEKIFIRTTILVVVVLVLFLAFGSNYIFQQNQLKLLPDCLISNTYKANNIVNGDSMQPMLQDQQEIILIKHYYKCFEPQVGDIVAYDYAGNDNPIIKIIKVTDQDWLEIQNNKLFINNQILKNSVDQEYIFNNQEIEVLSLYIKENKLPADSYLIFGDNINSSNDSRVFGAVSRVDILGKFLVE